MISRRLFKTALWVMPAIAFGAILTCTGLHSHAQRPGPRKVQLLSLERGIVARQLASGEVRTEVLLAARPGDSARVVQRLANVSGRVLWEDTQIDLIRALLPIERVLEVFAWQELTAAQIDPGDDTRFFFMNDSQLGAAQGAKVPPGAPPDAQTPRGNPYTAESATEVLQFKEAHPSFDGRGVVIGSIEPVDVRTPSLSRAAALDGRPLPKFLDYILPPPDEIRIGAVPLENQSGYGWQLTQEVRADERGHVPFNGHSYKIPPGMEGKELRMALVRQSPDELPEDVSAAELTVLWAPQIGRVWMCEGKQSDFSAGIAFDPLPVLPHRPALAHLPPDDRRTFMVAVDLPARALRLRYAGSFYHGTMCASVATGHDFLNGRMEGVAPAAQLKVVDFGSSMDQTGGHLQAWMDLFRDPRVDVMTNSSTFADARNGFSDERNVYWQIVQRLGALYPKLMVNGVGNRGPFGLQEFGYTGSDNVLRNGAYTPKAAWEANFGVTPTEPETPPAYSAYGPTSDGSLQPELIALTGVFTAIEGRVNGPYYPMPPGYGLSGGNSASGPSAAGDIALLISAAKQSGIPYDPERLRIALLSTARFLGGVEPRVQGHGLIQVAQAWQMLRKLKDFSPPKFRTEAPVHTYNSVLLPTPHVGKGLYEQDWLPGQRGRREIAITRTSGPAGPVTYRLQWKQNASQAFSSSWQEIVLPLNQTVRLPVQIELGRSGSYSAIVSLVDAARGWIVHSVLCTVIAAEPLTQANGYESTVTGRAPNPGNGVVYVNVPEGATALRVQVKQQGGRNVRLNAMMPDGQRPRVGARSWREPQPSAREAYDQTFSVQQPGVWQLWLDHDGRWPPTRFDAARPRQAPASEFTMKMTAIGMQAEDVDLSSAAGTTNNAATVRWRNRLAPVAGMSVSVLGVGEAREREVVLPAGLAPIISQIEVPDGTRKLVVEVEAPADSAANVSLMVFESAAASGQLAPIVSSDLGFGGRKRIEVPEPKPGRYHIGLDAWGEIPAQGLKVRYREILFTAKLGTVTVDQPKLSGDTLVAEICWQDSRPMTPARNLVAELEVTGPQFITSGRGDPKPATPDVARRVPIATTIVTLQTAAVAKPDGITHDPILGQ